MIYGYARCSTNEERQDINRQKRELYTLGVTDEKYIYWEYESGMKDDRTEFNKLLDIVSEGDTIATTEVSRLTRSTKHLCEILQTVKDKKLTLNMERNIISQRVKSGMKNARAKGKQIGRPPITMDRLPDKFWKYYQKYQAGEINVSEFARLLKCSRVTIYKYLSMVE